MALLFSFVRIQDDTTLSTLLEAPYQAKLVEYLIVNVQVGKRSV